VPQFSYQAINEAGNTVTGTLEADGPEAAKNRLAAMGYIPVSVQRGGGAAGGGGGSAPILFLSRVKAQELILFTKQFRTMLGAGLSMLEILRVLEQQTENARLRHVCTQMTDDVKKGSTISDALANHKGVFSELYVSMVRAGETAARCPRCSTASSTSFPTKTRCARTSGRPCNTPSPWSSPWPSPSSCCSPS
jgi:type II secretory pathway component PulF